MAMTGTDIRELTDNGLAEAAGLISRREYNLSIVRTRQTAEFLIKNYAAEKGIAYTTLADTIEALYEQGAINRSSRDAFHNIRIFGNKAVHDGDNDPENAQKAYYLLKSEISTFLSRKTVSVDRTPVRLETGIDAKKQLGDIEVEISNDRDDTPGRRLLRNEESGSQERGAHAGSNRSSSDGSEDLLDNARRRIRREDFEEDDDERGDRRGRHSGGRAERSGRSGRNDRDGRRERRSGSSGRSSGRTGGSGRAARNGRSSGSNRSSQRRTGGREQESSGLSVYDLLRILLPVLVIILLIVIIRSFMAAKQPVETVPETTITETVIQETEAVTEPETTEPETTEPETTAAPIEYRTSTDGVNIRYADNQNRIYTQLEKGTNIGTVTEIDGSDFVAFTLDGVDVVVNKSFIEPIS